MPQGYEYTGLFFELDFMCNFALQSERLALTFQTMQSLYFSRPQRLGLRPGDVAELQGRAANRTVCEHVQQHPHALQQ